MSGSVRDGKAVLLWLEDSVLTFDPRSISVTGGESSAFTVTGRLQVRHSLRPDGRSFGRTSLPQALMRFRGETFQAAGGEVKETEKKGLGVGGGGLGVGVWGWGVELSWGGCVGVVVGCLWWAWGRAGIQRKKTIHPPPNPPHPLTPNL